MKWIIFLAVFAAGILCSCERQREAIEFIFGNEIIVIHREHARISIENDAESRSIIVISLRTDVAKYLHSATSRHIGDLMSLRIDELYEVNDITIDESFRPQSLHLVVNSTEDAQRIVDMWGGSSEGYSHF